MIAETDPPQPAAHDSPYRWVVLSGIWLIYFSFGLQINALAPLVGPISVDLGLSYSAMGTVLSAWPLFYVFASIPCGALVDRIGTRRALLIAAAVMSASALARVAAVDFWSLFFAIALFGIGGPLLSITAPKAVAKWFVGRERGLAMGIYFTGVSIGSVAALALSNTVLMPLADGNWRLVLFFYAAITGVGGAYWYAISRRKTFRRADTGADEAGRGTVRQQIAVFGYLLRIPAVVLILLMSMGMFYFYDSTTNWLPEILIAHGLAPGQAGLWAAAPVAVGVAASLLIPRLATPERRGVILLMLFVCVGLGAVLLLSSNPIALGGAFIGHGIARGALMTVALMMLMETKGIAAHQIGAAGGLFFTAAEIGGVFGPLSFGVLFDITGTFAAPLFVLTGVSVALIILLGLHRRAVERDAPHVAAVT
ncbi:MAG: MFS transporter [Alphaproteobacteria bacterium]